MKSTAQAQVFLACCRGDQPADLVLKNCRIINTFTDSISTGDVAIWGDRIAGIGDYEGRQEIDLDGCLLCPGFIDGHIHLESSMLSPAQFARATVPHGTACIICDPHEIANVAGLAGIRALLEASRDLDVSILAMAPSCVPATSMETSGAAFGPQEIDTLLAHPGVLGLAEMMNYPGVVAGEEQVVEILLAARKKKHLIDGHAPALGGQALQAYIAAGISSDHECVDLQEAQEKLANGMYIYIREGSTARNLEALLPLVNPVTASRCLLVSDDRHPDDLLHKGHLDALLRKAVGLGLDPLLAIRMLTATPAARFGLHDRGAIAPGRRADFLVLDNLQQCQVKVVYFGGRLVARNGRYLGGKPPVRKKLANRSLTDSVHIGWDTTCLAVPAREGTIRVIDLVPEQIITRWHATEPAVVNGYVQADPKRDILKIAVLERHRASGHCGIGFVRGFGLTGGALASTVAHDSHNLVVVGCSDRDMMTAARILATQGGGLCAVHNGSVMANLQLELAGLLTSRTIEEVCKDLAGLRTAWQAMGCRLENPFMQLSFLALPVIPELKITDQGLVDLSTFQIVPLWQ